jgi:hypothetical protein
LIEATKTWINSIAFTQVTALAKCMQVAEVVGAAFSKGNNVVDVQWRLLSRFTAALALMAIAC